jgi:hypothetical protein
MLSPDSGSVTKVSLLLHIGHVIADDDDEDIDSGCIIENYFSNIILPKSHIIYANWADIL